MNKKKRKRIKEQLSHARGYPEHFTTPRQYNEYRKRIRLQVYQRDNFICQYCGFDMRILFELWYNKELRHEVLPLSIDHLVAKKEGEIGRNWEFGNLVTSCKRCNGLKGNKEHIPF